MNVQEIMGLIGALAILTFLIYMLVESYSEKIPE